MRRQERKTSVFVFHKKKPEKEHQSKSKVTNQKQVIEVRAEINDIEAKYGENGHIAYILREQGNL